jgi:hypothetical protein
LRHFELEFCRDYKGNIDLINISFNNILYKTIIHKFDFKKFFFGHWDIKLGLDKFLQLKISHIKILEKSELISIKVLLDK